MSCLALGRRRVNTHSGGTSMPGARLYGMFQWGVMLQQLLVVLWVCAGAPRVPVLKDLSSHTAGAQLATSKGLDLLSG